MNIDPDERLALFIDGANLFSASRALGFEIDFRRLLENFAARGRLVRAYYYTILAQNLEYSPIRPLLDWLAYNGYAVVTKPPRESIDATGERIVSNDMDIEIAVDAWQMAGRIDHAVLFSGDRQFRRLVEAIQRKGVRVSVASTRRGSPPFMSDELRRQADAFIELHDLAPRIARAPREEETRVPKPARVATDTADAGRPTAIGKC